MLPIADCFQGWYQKLVLSASHQTVNAPKRSKPSFSRAHGSHQSRDEVAVGYDRFVPAATVTGHCVLLSMRWLCLVCPAGPCRAPRWTCPCWQYGRYLKQWSGNPGCGPISFPWARSSLGTAETQQHGRKTINTRMNIALNRQRW